jgi:hypothetical protein
VFNINTILFNIFIDGVLSEVMERRAALMSDSGGEWQLNQILYTDDTTLVADEK